MQYRNIYIYRDITIYIYKYQRNIYIHSNILRNREAETSTETCTEIERDGGRNKYGNIYSDKYRYGGICSDIYINIYRGKYIYRARETETYTWGQTHIYR